MLTSCSSDPDPCDDITCVNASCDLGVCNCDQGFYGSNCDVTSLEGFYFLTGVRMESCPLYAKEYNLNAAEGSTLVCGLNHKNIELCFSNAMTLYDDGTMNWIRSITLDNGDGTVNTRFLEFKKGIYAAQGEDMVVTLENGDIRNIKIEKGEMTWDFDGEDGGPDCKRKEVYTMAQ